MKKIDYKKEQYRGMIKQFMKVRGLRTISLENFKKWKGEESDHKGIHSVKLNLQDGYVNIHGYHIAKTGSVHCGEAIQDANSDTYKEVYEEVIEIIQNESKIPAREKKNILVGLSR